MIEMKTEKMEGRLPKETIDVAFARNRRAMEEGSGRV